MYIEQKEIWMSLGGFVRRTIFWHNDRRKKEGKMFSAYKEIKQINSKRTVENEQYIQRTLEKLLTHATSSTEFYSKIVRGGKIKSFFRTVSCY